LARAKRTERADARRRYREATAATTNGEGAEAPEIAAAALPRDARAHGSAPAPEPEPKRRGFGSGIFAAVGPVDIRGDLRALPHIFFRSKAIWLPGLIIVVTAVAMILPTLSTNELVVLAGNVVLQPPPMIMAFLGGMLAPRGAWLVGGLIGLLSSLAFVFVIAATTDVIITPLGFPYQVLAEQKASYAVNVLATAPIFGIAIGAFAGFYRRFLNASAAKRQAAGRR
jgi:hypothetical protein